VVLSPQNQPVFAKKPSKKAIFDMVIHPFCGRIVLKSFPQNHLKGETAMNKADLVQSIAQKTELSKKDAEAALNSFVESVEESLAKGEKVTLVGFGTFEVKARAARTGVNPQTKAKIKIPASKAPAFRAGKDLKEKVNVKEKKASKKK
jgi:DNA-binding protein HU-beta